ncbi:Junctophilin-1 [Cichlidogyrus casuarinus]|uniref:Junctophilin-1 n=1 Tax=Cichlidogyrus casuarinus TaxID=1844966 RepID=A0ABD2PMA1_9PLAT
MYAGAWAKGMRQGLGIRTSAPYGVAAEQHKTMRAAQSQNSLPSAAGSDLHWRGPGSSGGGSGAGVDIIGGERLGRTDEIRSGFVLRSSSAGPVESGQSYSNFFSSGQRSAGGFFRNPFDRSNKSKSRSGSLRNLFSRKLKKQKSTGDLMSIGAHTTIGATPGSAEPNNRAGGSIKSNFSALSYTAARHASAGLPFTHQKDSAAAQLAIARRNFDEPSAPNVTESYAGQWNEDRRSGYGQAERSDGLRYEGEWFNNKKDGYGCTYFPDGTKEEGRYKENIIVQCLNRKSRLFMIRHTRLRDFVEEAVKKAQEAAREAKEKSADTAHQRAQTARTVAKKAETKARIARILADHARSVSEEYDPDFVQLGKRAPISFLLRLELIFVSR